MNEETLPAKRRKMNDSIPSQELEFYLLDACIIERKLSSTRLLVLLGKTFSKEKNLYVSCCVVVKNILRQVYLLKRDKRKDSGRSVKFADVDKEFARYVCETNKISKHESSYEIMNYPFDPDIPPDSPFVSVFYPDTYKILARTTSGYTFSRVLGTRTNLLETFLVQKRIKGACWLKVKNIHRSEMRIVSNCEIEINCDSVHYINVIQESTNGNINVSPSIPPLTLLTINVRSCLNEEKRINEIYMIYMLVQSNYEAHRHAVEPNTTFQRHFCVVAPPPNGQHPNDFYKKLMDINDKTLTIQKIENERALLKYFLMQYNKIDPDLIIGYDLTGKQLKLLLQRLQACDITCEYQLGKIGENLDHDSNDSNAFNGRLICDLPKSSRELIKMKSYNLKDLFQEVLKTKALVESSFSQKDLSKIYGNSQDLLDLIQNNRKLTELILKLIYKLNVIPISIELSNLCGNLLRRTLIAGMAERCEYFLLHAFQEANVIPKEVEDTNECEPKVDNSYIGGLVLEPKCGVYDKFVLTMDFASFYPNIIREFNICFTTIKENDYGSKNLGILPRKIGNLIDTRQKLKAMIEIASMASTKNRLETKSIALKLIANGVYGCLGCKRFRFYAKHLAELICLNGREILKETKALIEDKFEALDVIYGDTDSLFINTNTDDYPEALKIAKDIEETINEKYKFIKLKFDCLYKRLLLIAKKKYAGVKLTEEMATENVYKGIEFCRNDSSVLSGFLCKTIIDITLSETTYKEKKTSIEAYLNKITQELMDNKVPIELLTIRKRLHKDPMEYERALSEPHVYVALRINSDRDNKHLKVGDIVDYVICDNNFAKKYESSLCKKAWHVDEFKKINGLMENRLKIDVNYYLKRELYPLAKKLCEYIDGIIVSPEEVAKCLRLDLNKGKSNVDDGKNAEGDNDEIFTKSKLVRLKYSSNVEPFKYLCYHCDRLNIINSVMLHNDYVLACMYCDKCPLSSYENLKSCLTEFIEDICWRRCDNNVYSCEIPICKKKIDQKTPNDIPLCTSCSDDGKSKRINNPKDLHYQFIFLLDIFSADKLPEGYSVEMEKNCQTLQELILDVMKRKSSYTMVNMSPFVDFFCKFYDLDQSDTDDDDDDIRDI